MIAFPSTVIDSVTRVAPFGARFWDPPTRRFIGDGLRVQAYLGEPGGRRTEGFANGSGVYVVAGLPGMRGIENGRGDDGYWNAVHVPTSPPRRPFTIEVTDRQDRFLPFRFETTLPVRGLFKAAPRATTSPPVSRPSGTAEYLPLFSTPSRAPPAALATVRAQLRGEAAMNEPASWARVDAWCQAQRVSTGMADVDGRVVLFFAYPEPIPKRLVRVSPTPFVVESSWAVTLTAFYTRPAVDRSKFPAMPDLDAFFGQAPRPILAVRSPPIVLNAQQLELGHELVVRSPDSSYLFV